MCADLETSSSTSAKFAKGDVLAGGACTDLCLEAASLATTAAADAAAAAEDFWCRVEVTTGGVRAEDGLELALARVCLIAAAL